MPPLAQHPILDQSFAVIDQEIGPHAFAPEAYAIVRRVIHSTADFEFKQLLWFKQGAIESGIAALQTGCPIVVDVSMVRQGIASMVQRTFKNPILTAIDAAPMADPGRTRTETGLLRCWQQAPEAIYVIGNAPTALIALCDAMIHTATQPALVVGAPVGFIAVEDSKARLSGMAVPQIGVAGRKGGSAVAAAILNALLVLAWERQ